MTQNQQGTIAVRNGWRSALLIACLIAVVLIAFFILRDGFGWGDIVGGLIIGVMTLAVLEVVRRVSQR